VIFASVLGRLKIDLAAVINVADVVCLRTGLRSEPIRPLVPPYVPIFLSAKRTNAPQWAASNCLTLDSEVFRDVG
jgi:hypothetical protein